MAINHNIGLNVAPKDINFKFKTNILLKLFLLTLYNNYKAYQHERKDYIYHY